MTTIKLPKKKPVALADDLLYGAKEICQHLFGEVNDRLLRRTYSMLENKAIPYHRNGAVYVARKSAIDRAFAEIYLRA